uniref:Vanin-like protein 1 n=1 Tax=Syphacia muris TaxID=451379 RepID=A0A0N5ANS7_9BILA
MKAIHFVDPTKHGFRVILLESFVQSYLPETQMPTLFVTAIPLKYSDGFSVTKVVVPDSVREDRQVKITDLREQLWYYVCIEWENINRYNETTGTDCRILRTLDRFGKGAETTVVKVKNVDTSATTMNFELHSIADFPIRLTAYLQGGSADIVPAQEFVFSEPTNINLEFKNLREYTDYGQLCFIEEPLTNGYTALGRHVAGLSIRKCHFSKLQTKDYELSTSSFEAFPLRRAASGTKLSTTLTLIAVLSVLLYLLTYR